jgi:hypothetical protein
LSSLFHGFYDLRLLREGTKGEKASIEHLDATRPALRDRAKNKAILLRAAPWRRTELEICLDVLLQIIVGYFLEI